ncbi:hypothetical protein S7711_04740 [Stachybotrys chartarum IBT 7711]|uniref:Uncharacterized protein n=1 Tax=Stachybotrys chartarum (strain CBS 109288 / IBT 7711) TaxID=1280523 RepID=A0A084AP39_STACB|nr:hypothetical protein S7711_04740 [Stachybotrys chartarum IBT 7711]KFA53795.1 hypothetical protein S40293_01668 [Stachybotrys chartarum IBT 40293]
MAVFSDSLAVSTAGIAVALATVVFALKAFISPTIDPAEPVALESRIPLVGHIVSMIRHKATFYTRLYKRSGLPIYTLPILNGKLYIINSPGLVQAAMRSNDISFDPFMVEFSTHMFGLSPKVVEIISRPEVMDDLVDIIHASLMNESLHQMNVKALAYVASVLNGIRPDEPLRIQDTFLWLRDNMTYASTCAIFGSKNPYKIEDIPTHWEFDAGAVLLSLNVAPSLVAGKALAARGKLNQILIPFYQAKLDQGPDVSAIIRKRAVKLRESGFDDVDLGVQELMLPWVGNTNTIPALFWLFAHLFTHPGYLAKVRTEVEALVVRDGDTATLAASKFEKQLPMLYACYQECLRMYLHNVGARRVMADTRVQDTDGREYLLKKGVNIQWPPGVLQHLPSVWGADADDFYPERWLGTTTQEEKKRRGAFVPFGGGKHLCPGRKFALAEILGFVATLAVGFEAEGVNLPGHEDPLFGQASRRPVWGGKDKGATIRRREGWENVVWKFIE